jgi:hypothetical protein
MPSSTKVRKSKRIVLFQDTYVQCVLEYYRVFQALGWPCNHIGVLYGEIN